MPCFTTTRPIYKLLEGNASATRGSSYARDLYQVITVFKALFRTDRCHVSPQRALHSGLWEGMHLLLGQIHMPETANR